VLLTMHQDVEYAISAIDAQASGYVLKQSAPDELKRALRQVLAGQTYVPPALAAEVFKGIRQRDQQALPELSERQIDILRGLAEGLTAKEIAAQMDVSRKTVEYHKYRLQDLLGAKTTAELIRYAIENGLVSR
jgi:DNA-binding NarL/FixJ family response regulator